ncbi:MAG: cupin domain-containing protein [Silicimonas sp.]|nr:cupin domain-containing protein [Silicimonas sp.]
MAEERPRTYDVLGNVLRFLTFPSEVDGKFCLVEAIVPEGMGAPPNHHAGETEAFYVLDGEVGFHVDGRDFVARAGDHIAIPDGAVHAFKGIARTSRLLILNAPGEMHDAFFTGVGRPMPEGSTEPLPPEGPPDVEALLAFAASKGMTVLNPEDA